MAKYPKFLKKMPSVFGFDFIDLSTIAVMLFISSILNFSALVALVLCVIAILITKVLRRYIDFTVLFVKKIKRIGEF